MVDGDNITIIWIDDKFYEELIIIKGIKALITDLWVSHEANDLLYDIFVWNYH